MANGWDVGYKTFEDLIIDEENLQLLAVKRHSSMRQWPIGEETLLVLKTMAEGKDYCERKINLLKSNYDQLLERADEACWMGVLYTESRENCCIQNLGKIQPGPPKRPLHICFPA
ncbi:hypothetical protein RHGRI_026242 [Rhododendron griersonianum]|uniref:Uncharacterized protein n=1 Tax=Rhododendron griersonianum TaxID=479676 RepID=A0AAV6IUD4_9ERIC|nr:hypothetical protein RHGRI_026242 [Rhododendron griersonianum]